jgi:glycosyltransferase involved in cell wall biosynthesis
LPERVGVAVPCRNAARFLAAALDSVTAPDGVELDVVVVDDGSTDGSAGVARARGVRVVDGPQQGIGPARSLGVAEVAGDWLAFVDADDEWMPGRLEAGLAAFAADPDLDVCWGHAEIFHDVHGVQKVVPGVLPGTLLLRRATWDAVGPMRSLRAGEVADWLLRARDLGLRERMLTEVLLRRRIHDANTTRDREGLRDYAKVLKDGLDRRRAAAAAAAKGTTS